MAGSNVGGDVALQDDPYFAMLRQAVHDCVRAVLLVATDPAAETRGLSAVLNWVVRTHGPRAATDLAFHLALDLSEMIAMVARQENIEPLAAADRWFHAVPVPSHALNPLSDDP